MKRCVTLLLVSSFTLLAAAPHSALAQQSAPDQPRSTVHIAIGKDRRLRAERAQAARAQRAHDDSIRAEAARDADARVEAARLEAARADSARAEAVRAEAARDSSARAEAAREDAAREQAARDQAAADASRQSVRQQGSADSASRSSAVGDAAESDAHLRALSRRHMSGFYAGVGGGASAPTPGFNQADHLGWHVEVPIGYDPVDSPVGIRVAAGYGQNAPFPWFSNVGNAQLMTADGDLKLRFVHASAADGHFQLYALGGATYVRFRDIVEQNPSGGWQIGNNPPVAGAPPADTTWQKGLGWNAGAGLEFGRGRTNLFIEARYTRFKGVVSNLATIPVLVGLTLY